MRKFVALTIVAAFALMALADQSNASPRLVLRVNAPPVVALQDSCSQGAQLAGAFGYAALGGSSFLSQYPVQSRFALRDRRHDVVVVKPRLQLRGGPLHGGAHHH